MIYTITLITHIIAVMIAVGTVTVTDYIHLLGLRNPKIERKSLFVFPHLSNIILLSLITIYTTGIIMTLHNPTLLTNPLFQTKITLVILVTINGYILHKHIFPKIEHHIKTKQYNPTLTRLAALGGSISIVTWYSIVILSITKTTQYTPTQFIIPYTTALINTFILATIIETKTRHHHHLKDLLKQITKTNNTNKKNKPTH